MTGELVLTLVTLALLLRCIWLEARARRRR